MYSCVDCGSFRSGLMRHSWMMGMSGFAFKLAALCGQRRVYSRCVKSPSAARRNALCVWLQQITLLMLIELLNVGAIWVYLRVHLGMPDCTAFVFGCLHFSTRLLSQSFLTPSLFFPLLHLLSITFIISNQSYTSGDPSKRKNWKGLLTRKMFSSRMYTRKVADSSAA